MRRSSTPRGRLLAGLTLLLAAAAVASGCRQGTFLGDRYNNFRAYYNTFYNARKAFEEGEEQLIRLDERVDRSLFLPIFADVPAEASPTPTPGATSGPFQDAVDKSADLLRERPTSKWADDALLLIGRSYFYQRNLVGAEGKFRETIAAAEERGEEALVDEARFWLGRTLAAQERYDEAVLVLEEGLARDGLSRYWRARMQLALAEQYVQQRLWDEAAAALETGLADVRDADLAGRAYFLLGQVREAKGDYEGAAAAYAAVEDHRPYYELLYAAQLSRALVLGLYAGRHDDALALARQMRRDDKHFQKRAEVELAYARLLAAAGRHGEARERFEELLYGDDFTSAAVPRNEVHYYYGAFYRDQLNDYVRAAAYLDTASTGLRTDPGREALLTHAALTGVRREAEAFLDYAAIARELAEADSLLDLGALDDDAFAARVAEIEAERRRAWEEEQRRLAALQAQAGFEGGPVGVVGGDPYNRPPAGTPPPGAADAGFLNYRDVVRLQDALVAFQSVWGDRPLVPNWRRRQAIGSGVADEALADVGATGGIRSGQTQGGPPPLDLSAVPRTPEARARLLTERASLRYELGNVLFLSLARPDSAAYWYGLVVEKDASEPVAARALYALAEVRREQGRTAEAEALYRRLLETAPESDLAGPAREWLGLPPLEADDATEAAGRAAAAYDDAYARWRRGDHPGAVRGFLDLAAAFGETDQVPRALLAAAEAFAEWARHDTLDVEDGIPAELVPPALLDSLAAHAEAVPPPPEVPEAAPPAPEGGEQDALETLQDAAEPAEDEPVEDKPVEDESLDPLGLGDESFEELEDEEVPSEAEGELPVPPVNGAPEPVTETDSTAVTGPLEAAEAEAPLDPIPTPADTMIAVADTTLAVADTTVAVADTTIAVADTTVAVADTSTAVPGVPLVDLLAFVETQYAGTPYAERARTHRTALLELAGIPVDAQDPTAPGTPAAQPVVGLPAAPADASLPPDIVSLLPSETFGLEGTTPINMEVGGFSWRLTAVAEPGEAYALLRTHAEQGLRTGVVREEGEGYAGFALLVGQFASVAEAEATRGALPAVASEAAPRVVALSGLRLLREADLRREVAPQQGDER